MTSMPEWCVVSADEPTTGETPVTRFSTEAGGQTPVPVDDGTIDPVRAALAQARGISRGQPVRRRSGGRRRGGQDAAATGRGGYSGPGPDPTDPQPIGEVLAGTRPGRQSPSDITVYKSIGHAVQDLAAAAYLYERG